MQFVGIALGIALHCNIVINNVLFITQVHEILHFDLSFNFENKRGDLRFFTSDRDTENRLLFSAFHKKRVSNEFLDKKVLHTILEISNRHSIILPLNRYDGMPDQQWFVNTGTTRCSNGGGGGGDLS